MKLKAKKKSTKVPRNKIKILKNKDRKKKYMRNCNWRTKLKRKKLL